MKDSVRILGVALDQKLLWDAHTEVVTKKLSKNAFVLRNLAMCVSGGILKQAYFSIFHAHLSYALLVWGHSTGAQRVFAMQRRAIRIIAGLGYRDDCKRAFIGNGILTLPCEFILQNLIYVKNHHDRYARHSDIHNYNTRNKSDLQPVFHRLQRCQNGPGFHAVTYFNKLPKAVKDLGEPQFKRKVKEFLLQKAFYSVNEFINCTLCWTGNKMQ